MEKILKNEKSEKIEKSEKQKHLAGTLGVRIDKKMEAKIEEIADFVETQTGKRSKSDAIRFAILRGIESIKKQQRLLSEGK